ncbi:hypothetical protein R1sor_007369 [Riccia sorocarpa]|uniref:Uncharacterized protein n=1 Tax=Riccia sorocarpa TaxID=122646 RepID=A0ABD3HQN9_9MARC
MPCTSAALVTKLQCSTVTTVALLLKTPEGKIRQSEQSIDVSDVLISRLKKGATKGGLSRSNGTRPDVDDEEVEKKGGMSKDAQVRTTDEGARKGGRARAEQLELGP